MSFLCGFTGMDFPEAFRDAFVKTYAHCFVSTREATLCASRLRYYADAKLIQDSHQMRIRWKLVLALQADAFRERSYFYQDEMMLKTFIIGLRLGVDRFLGVQRIMRRVVGMITEWYHNKVLRSGVVVARNRKDLLPDQKFEVRYHPREGYFATAFSGRFGADLENGEYVIKVKAAGTSQDAIGLYCVFTSNHSEGRSRLFAHLDQALLDGLDSFRQTYGCVVRLGELFLDEHFTRLCESYIYQYMEDTILNQNGFSSLQRLERFISVKPVLAEHIWTENLSTQQERATLATQLKISKRNMGGFKNATTTADLQKFIVRKWDSKRSLLDDLPKHLWDRIQNAETEYEFARRGHRVGLRGWYISSDSIDVARNRLRNAWRDADVWISHHVVKAK